VTSFFFFEGNNCSQEVVGTMPYHRGDGRTRHVNAKKVSWFENDEARSLLVKGLKKGAVIVLYDHPDAKTKDDFSVIEIKKDAPKKGVCIGTFERSMRAKDGAWELVYVRKNGLDGKVSHIVVSPKPRANAYPSDVIFYEGNNCKQGVKARFDSHSDNNVNCKKSDRCVNDEVRSVKLWSYGKSKFKITVYDNPDGKKNDDWTTIEVDTTKFVGKQCLKTFEKDIKMKGVKSNFHKDNGLDGKVSRIKIK